MKIRNYLENAKKDECIFRAVLRDLEYHKNNRPLGHMIPQDFDHEGGLESIFEKYSSGERSGLFTILDFCRSEEEKVIIQFQNINYQSKGGYGVELRYRITSPNSVEYEISPMDWQFNL